VFFLKLCWWRFKKQIVLQLLLVFQLFFFVIGMVITTGTILEHTLSVRLLNGIQGMQDALYWTIDDEPYLNKASMRYEELLSAGTVINSDPDVANKAYINYIDSIENNALQSGAFAGSGKISTHSFSTEKGVYDLQLYNAELAGKIRLPMADGHWLDYQTDSGLPGIIVDTSMRYDYPIGSLVEGVFTRWDSILKDEVKYYFNMEVVGVVNMKGFIFDFRSGGNVLRASNFFTALSNYAIIDASKFTLELGENSENTRMLFMNDGIFPEEKEKALEYLWSSGYLQNMNAVKANSLDYFRFLMGYEFPPNLMIIMLGLISLIGSIALSSIISNRENAIYSICGATPILVKSVEWFRCGILLLIASTLAYLHINYSGVWHAYMAENTFAYALFFTVLLYGLLLMITNKQKLTCTPINEFRKWGK
jgi:hypothetical protein